MPDICDRNSWARFDASVKLICFLLEKFVIQEHLWPEACLYILPLPPDSPEIHVQKIGSAVDVERSGRNVEFCIISVIFVTVSCACYYEKNIVGTHSFSTWSISLPISESRRT